MLQQGILKLFGEEPLALHLAEGDVLDPVTPGRDDLDLARETKAIVDEVGDPTGLPQSEI